MWAADLEVYGSLTLRSWLLTLRYVGLVPGVDPPEGGRRCSRSEEGYELRIAGCQRLDGVDQIRYGH